jgi:uncharacterized protein YlxP (DUF503 family)
MIIGVMVLDFINKNIHSLKEKRQILSSIKDKCHQRFNISIAETADQDLWQKIQLAAAMVSTSKVVIEKTFQQIENFIMDNYPLEISKIHFTFY